MYEESIVLFGQVISLIIALGTLAVLIRTYLTHRMRVLLIWSAAWVFFILMQVAFYTGNKEGVAIFYSLFSGVLMYGVLRYLGEHEGFETSIKPELIGIIPPLFTLYGILLARLGLPYSFYSTEVPFVVLSGIFFLFSGGVFLAMGKKQRTSRYLGIATAAFGLFVLLYPVRLSFSDVRFAGPIHFSSVWIALGTVLSAAMAFFMIKLVTSREFLFIEGPVELKVNLEPGARLLTPREYGQIKKDLKDYPVLAFVRSLDVPERWEVYYLGTEGGEDRLSPTNLARMAHIVNEYFREARKEGINGVVVIDCPEYLVMYNGFEPIVKFLASLRDSALINNGMLLVVADEKAWDKGQIAILRRILG